ncbi:MAG: molecular chaperone DnaJ [Bdellovibrionales bacterium RBG_16_40_8]|nr:MAG: molecular chaperone DnaJ [Bdellovibrionales bacterium RBG_16_40_8]
MAKDYYDILGVSKGSDKESIKKAYRQMAMKYHPDRNPGDHAAEAKFKEASEAYGVLSDDSKRSRYDRFGHAGVNGFGGGGGAGFHDINDIFSAFGDVFSDFFGGATGQRTHSRSRARRGSDLRYFLEIDLKDVLVSSQKEIQFDTEEACVTCEGSGAKLGTKPETCNTCSGSGQVVRQQGFFTMATTCHTCRGEGVAIKEKCQKCRGAGRTHSKRKLSINIPAGVDSGTQLRLSGEGESGYLGGGPGDLYVEIRVRPDERFERDGQHLHSELSISYLQAILGAEIKVKTLSDESTVEVEPGSHSGDKIRLRHEGLPSVRSSTRGDLFYHLKIDFPKKMTKKEEELLREIAKEKNEQVLGPSGFFGRKKS